MSMPMWPLLWALTHTASASDQTEETLEVETASAAVIEQPISVRLGPHRAPVTAHPYIFPDVHLSTFLLGRPVPTSDMRLAWSSDPLVGYSFFRQPETTLASSTRCDDHTQSYRDLMRCQPLQFLDEDLGILRRRSAW